MKDAWKRWCCDNSVKFIEKEKPKKKKIKKVIGEVFGHGDKIDEEERGVLTEVERLMRQGVEVFTEIEYKCTTIEFYYFTDEENTSSSMWRDEADLADCHITPQSEVNGSGIFFLRF